RGFLPFWGTHPGFAGLPIAAPWTQLCDSPPKATDFEVCYYAPVPGVRQTVVTFSLTNAAERLTVRRAQRGIVVPRTPRVALRGPPTAPDPTPHLSCDRLIRTLRLKEGDVAEAPDPPRSLPVRRARPVARGHYQSRRSRARWAQAPRHEARGHQRPPGPLDVPADAAQVRARTVLPFHRASCVRRQPGHRTTTAFVQSSHRQIRAERYIDRRREQSETSEARCSHPGRRLCERTPGSHQWRSADGPRM